MIANKQLSWATILDCNLARKTRLLAESANTEPARVIYFAIRTLLHRYKDLDSTPSKADCLSFWDILISSEEVLENIPTVRVEWQEARIGDEQPEYILQLRETHNAGLEGLWIYQGSSLNEERLFAFAEHFRLFLTNVTAYADRLVRGIPLITEEELKQIELWNQTRTEYPRNSLVHELFEQQALAIPSAIAITCAGESVTYGLLNARANQLAHHLSMLGVNSESVVGIALERSISMVVAMLAVLKAGGCYLPLDATYPPERLRFMVEDSDSKFLVTSASSSSIFEGLGIAVIEVDSAPVNQSQYPIQNLRRRGTAESLAYVMYTSGSTGVPKGVEVPHRGIIRLVKNTDYVRIDRTDKIAQISKFSFDAITFEVWGALLNGAQISIFPHEVVLSPSRLAGEIRDSGITTMFLTAALFNMVAKVNPSAFAGVRNLLAGGDVVSPESARLVLNTAPPRHLINGYGPTECTTFSCCHQITEISGHSSSIPIGRPIANSEAYVLDKWLLPVPVGVVGEIYLGGDGLARGYRNRPELTAQRFVPHVMRPETGARLYKTGDRGRYRKDGSIEFAGRTDNQVKLRGHRIELGEIEAALCKHPDVSGSVVLICALASGEPFLSAYVERRSRCYPNGEELKQYLAGSLPGFMIPSHIAIVDEFPLTPVGKIDKAALQATHSLKKAATSVAPVNDIEKQIADAWSRILGTTNLGLDDNFFDLGGNSLLMAALEADLQGRLMINVTITDMFRYSTIRSLGAFVANRTHAKPSLEAAKLRAQRQKDTFQRLRRQPATQ